MRKVHLRTFNRLLGFFEYLFNTVQPFFNIIKMHSDMVFKYHITMRFFIERIS